jgi:DNA-binding transcriptional regulator YhcF (GntR family)
MELERDGVILTRQGKGSYVAEQPGLAADLLDREMREHLSKAASLGCLLGRSKQEMIRLMTDYLDQNHKEES